MGYKGGEGRVGRDRLAHVDGDEEVALSRAAYMDGVGDIDSA